MDAAVPDLVRQVPHVAFEVPDLASDLASRKILIPTNSPSDGVRVAFIDENGGPIELLEFTDTNQLPCSCGRSAVASAFETRGHDHIDACFFELLGLAGCRRRGYGAN